MHAVRITDDDRPDTPPLDHRDAGTTETHTTSPGTVAGTSDGGRPRRHHGTTRTVWAIGKWVIKTPSTRPVLPHRTSRLHAFARG